MHLLEAKSLYKSYNQTEVLKGISFAINKGDFISIVGASGAGKSTLLNIISTIDKPDSGEIWYKGENILKYNDKKLSEFRNKQIGFVFQFHNLFPEFTALENVCIPAFIGKKNHKETVNEALKLLDMLALSHRARHKPSQLSGGEQQRVAVARALINKPAIIFADEPSGNLDTANANELHKLFFELRERLEQTFVVVTHSPTFAKMADKTWEIKDGLLT